MKLSMELIRSLLEYVEDHGKGTALCPPRINGYDKYTIAYHVGLCHEAGFIHLSRKPASAEDQCLIEEYSIVGLTWSGHEKLEEIRNKNFG